MITSCNCVSGGSGVCILCLFMPFAKVSLVEGLGSLVVVSFENQRSRVVWWWRMTKLMGGRALGKRTHKHTRTTCWAFGFQSSVRIPGQNLLEFLVRIPSCSSFGAFGFRGHLCTSCRIFHCLQEIQWFQKIAGTVTHNNSTKGVTKHPLSPWHSLSFKSRGHNSNETHLFWVTSDVRIPVLVIPLQAHAKGGRLPVRDEVPDRNRDKTLTASEQFVIRITV